MDSERRPGITWWACPLSSEFLDHAGPFETILQAQAAVDSWVAGYNCDRPHQALEMGYRRSGSLPARHSATRLKGCCRCGCRPSLSPRHGPLPQAVPASTRRPSPGQPVDPVREDADAPRAEVVYRGGPVEFERVVPASGNLGVAGKQFWLGPVRGRGDGDVLGRP